LSPRDQTEAPLPTETAEEALVQKQIQRLSELRTESGYEPPTQEEIEAQKEELQRQREESNTETESHKSVEEQIEALKALRNNQ